MFSRLRTIQPNLRALARAQSSSTKKPFNKILIANRGEIACRIIRTARRLGVQTVAIYSEPDASSMHVRLADEAYLVGPASSKDSYLRMDRILEVAKRTGAEGIHPGYGFLSENAKFADMVEAAGIAFIGPSSKPMNLMGDKINSKKIAKDANCYIIPGFEGEVENEDRAVELAREVGYPVMIKASAGGGGKGMRVAYNDAEVREGFRLSKAEALSSFGDDRMLIERFIENPHHIEIQVLADTHGNVVAFPERECSVQRRNQKVVEESPSPYLHESTRRLMQQQAIQLCKAVGYRSAGTIEMLADDKQNFFFLEMNTRLQVEHPITELVSGEDLVEHMLWIAAGKVLPSHLTSKPLRDPVGHAIESRVYAEDPLRNFLPAVGPLITYREPELFAKRPAQGSVLGETVRLDTGVYEGGVISTFYDPMIAKLCSHADTRARAIALQQQSVDSYVVSGLVNNLCFLRDVYRHPAFNAGEYSTKFIAQEYPKGFHGVQLSAREQREALGVAAQMHMRRAVEREEGGAWQDTVSFVLVLGDAFKGPAVRVTVIPASFGENAADEVTFEPLNEAAQHLAGSQTLAVLAWEPETALATAEVLARDAAAHPAAGVEHEADRAVEAVQFLNALPGAAFSMRYRGADLIVSPRTEEEHTLFKYMQPLPVLDTSKAVLSPMPGTLISVAVKVGQRVEEGQTVAVVEAMKMQNSLKAGRAGIVKKVKAPGAALKVDEIVLEFE